MSFNKENMAGEMSPLSHKALKPISPNRAGVGKLSFLHSDNLDEHLSTIHHTHKDIQDQLYNIEVQTKQTNVDLDQLFDRLKNNNENLNRVLENISNYSKEVITEGNATKKDINNIFTRFDRIDRERLTSEVLNSLLTKETEVIKKSISNIPTTKDIANVVNSRTTDQKSLADQLDKLSTKFDFTKSDIVANLDIQSGTIQDISEAVATLTKSIAEQKNSDLEFKLLQALNLILPKLIAIEDLVRKEKGTSDSAKAVEKNDIIELSKNIKALADSRSDINHRKEIVEPIIDEFKSLKLDDKSTLLLEGIFQKLENYKTGDDNSVNLLNQLLRQLKEKDSQIEALEGRVNTLNAILLEISQRISLQDSIQTLQSKHDVIESKYKMLCNQYQEKYDELVRMQNDFQLLKKTLDADYFKKIANVKDLHFEQMSKLQSSLDLPKKTASSLSKRIVSTPIAMPSLDEVNNSDGEF